MKLNGNPIEVVEEAKLLGVMITQKTALAIRRAERHTTSKEALYYYDLFTLEARPETLCIRFAIKTQKNPKFSHWFQKN